MEGEIPCYGIAVNTTDAGVIHLQVTKTGGHVLMMVPEFSPGETNHSVDTCRASALAFLQSRQYGEVEPAYYQVNFGMVTFNFVPVQDGVRPLGSVAMIRRVAEAAAKHGAAIPVVEPVDSFRETDGEADAAGRAASHIVDRRLLRIVQTPQIFRAEVLRRAYESEYRAEFTDDASVVEAVGQAVCLAEGERENLKLTTPGDFVIAEALIAAREEAENEEGTTDAEHV